jgi:hypothetical protein
MAIMVARAKNQPRLTSWGYEFKSKTISASDVGLGWQRLDRQIKNPAIIARPKKSEQRLDGSSI